MKLPAQGSSRDDVIARMREMKTQDADWRGARTWSLIYPAGEEVDELLAAANELYLFENALNPLRFPSLRQMELEVVRMTASLLHAPDGFGGSLSSGDTESILLGVKTLECRTRRTHYRGPILLHASKTIEADARQFHEETIAIPAGELWPYPVGAVRGAARIVGCRPGRAEDALAACVPPDHVERAFVWELSDVMVFAEPFDARGRLGLFDVEPPEDQLGIVAQWFGETT